ncbi:MAG TPA: sigma-70 family RNA polymerase sigma factor [Chloroflexaceae bacterium]|nr:sigma-70 family RNA polymerase sigma factor [Chloroflexaceae bacterium]
MTAPTLHHDVVRRAQAADPEALATIYERYAPAIFRYIYYRVGDVDLAHDIQSDVFVRMLEGIGRYEDRGWSIGSWLYRIAHARTVDNLRRRERHPVSALDEWNATVDGPDDGLEGSLRRGALRRAMERLCPSQRQVLLLRHVYGLSLEETARQLGRTIGSVKALQHRAHERAAQLIRADLGE